jgi:thiol-disulfide isomerase/thioredoxin
MKRILGLLALYAAALAALTGCQERQDKAVVAATPPSVETEQTAASSPAEPEASASPLGEESFIKDQLSNVQEQLGQPAQPLLDFSYTPFGAQEEVKVSSRIGKPLVVNFWAVWCEPCKMELPDFQEVYKERQGQFDLLSLCVDKQRDPEGFVKAQGYSWDFAFDGNGAAVYNISGIPRTLFVNAQGQVVVDFTGAMSRPAFEAALAGILKT